MELIACEIEESVMEKRNRLRKVPNDDRKTRKKAIVLSQWCEDLVKFYFFVRILLTRDFLLIYRKIQSQSSFSLRYVSVLSIGPMLRFCESFA